nr:hypothetical protein CFP56_50394 [Quercus suber]
MGTGRTDGLGTKNLGDSSPSQYQMSLPSHAVSQVAAPVAYIGSHFDASGKVTPSCPAQSNGKRLFRLLACSVHDRCRGASVCDVRHKRNHDISALTQRNADAGIRTIWTLILAGSI